MTNIFAPFNLSPLAQRRLLMLFNQAQTAQQLADTDLLTTLDPDKRDYGLGPVVAQRILDRRAEMPTGRFTTLAQLTGIDGFGRDKAEDLANFASRSALETFVFRLRKNVLSSNFELLYRSVSFEAAEPFLGDEDTFRSWLAGEALQLRTTPPDEATEKTFRTQINDAYREEEEIPHIGSYMLALWFYRFDQDNWFSFERMRRETDYYLDFMGENQMLQLYKGVDNGLLTPGGVTVHDLLVVQNTAERTFNFLTGRLLD